MLAAENGKERLSSLDNKGHEYGRPVTLFIRWYIEELHVVEIIVFVMKSLVVMKNR